MSSVVRPTRLAAGLVTGLLVAGCTTGNPVPDPVAEATPPGPPEVQFDVDLADFPAAEIYFLAGPDLRSQDIYRLDTATGDTERLTHSAPDRGISFMSATADQIVMADASTGQDQLVVLDRAGRRSPLRHDGVRGFSPTVSPAGELVYSQLHAGGAGAEEPVEFVLAVRDRMDGPDRSVMRHPGPLTGVWGPEGTIVVVVSPTRSDPRRPPEVVLLDPATGEVEQLQPKVPRPATLVAHPDSPYVVVGDPTAGSAGVLDTATGGWEPLPPGWIALCFDPAGESLLLARGGELAVAPVSEPSATRPIGTVRGGEAARCSWVGSATARG